MDILESEEKAFRYCRLCDKNIRSHVWDVHECNARKTNEVAPAVLGGINVSLHGKVFTDRKRLDGYLKEKGLTHMSDYSEAFFSRKRYERHDAMFGSKASRERRSEILRNFEKASRG